MCYDQSPFRRTGQRWGATRAPARQPKYEGRTQCTAFCFHTLVHKALNPGGLGAKPPQLKSVIPLMIILPASDIGVINGSA